MIEYPPFIWYGINKFLSCFSDSDPIINGTKDTPSILCCLGSPHSSVNVGYISIRPTVLLTCLFFGIPLPAIKNGTLDVSLHKVCLPPFPFSPK